METTRDRGPDTERSCELIEMHLLDADAREEESLCGAEVSVLDLTTVQNYLECRRHISSLPTVCNDCKVPAIHFARMRHSALADEGMTDEAEILPPTRRHAFGRDRPGPVGRLDWMSCPLIHMWAFLCVRWLRSVGTRTRCGRPQ